MKLRLEFETINTSLINQNLVPSLLVYFGYIKNNI